MLCNSSISFLPGPENIASFIFGKIFSLNNFTDSPSIFSFSITLFSLPISAEIFFWKFSNLDISTLAFSRAFSKSSSLASLADASIMLILPSFPQTVRSNLYCEPSSRSLGEAFILSPSLPFSLLYLPMRTAPIGPAQGIFDTWSANEAAFIAKMTESLSSTEITVVITCTA